MSDLKIVVPRGMLFIYDRADSDVIIPEYSPNNTVACTPSAISIAVQNEEDGEVQISLLNQFERIEKELILIGTAMISSMSVSLSLCVMGDIEIASIPSSTSTSKIEVFANRPSFPSIISIRVDSTTAA